MGILKKDKIIQVAIISFFTLSTTAVFCADNASTNDQIEKMEKCYGIAKAGMNDCVTATASCAGSAKKDNQKDAFILLPKGDCGKITGGSLTTEAENNKQ